MKTHKHKHDHIFWKEENREVRSGGHTSSASSTR